MITPTPAAGARSAGARGAGAPARGAAGVLTLADVEAAAHALGGVVARTPLLHDADVDAELGGRLLIKAECHRRTGAFKIRGAYHRMATLSAAERARGAITYSSGNHALGVALAGRLLDISALVVMPSDVPPAKMAAVRALGAEIATFERDTESSDAVVERLRARCGRVVVPPSADPRVLAGAVRFAFERFKIVVEPGAAVGLAAVLSGDVHIRGRTSATIVTGGNVDAARFGALLAE